MSTKCIFPQGFKKDFREKVNHAALNFSQIHQKRIDKIDEWKRFLAILPPTDKVNEFLHNGHLLHVPMKEVLFPICESDLQTIVPPLVSGKKRHNDGQPIKECHATANVPHSGDKKRKRVRESKYPADDVKVGALNEEHRQAFLKGMSTLTTKMLTRAQLLQLTKDAFQHSASIKQSTTELKEELTNSIDESTWDAEDAFLFRNEIAAIILNLCKRNEEKVQNIVRDEQTPAKTSFKRGNEELT